MALVVVPFAMPILFWLRPRIREPQVGLMPPVLLLAPNSTGDPRVGCGT
ncbi:MAG: hypothetical protein H6527_02850 [Actinobacteria bacterium]|nr:hypothetical protein [Actinomycetota bacterium]